MDDILHSNYKMNYLINWNNFSNWANLKKKHVKYNQVKSRKFNVVWSICHSLEDAILNNINLPYIYLSINYNCNDKYYHMEVDKNDIAEIIWQSIKLEITKASWKMIIKWENSTKFLRIIIELH